MIEWLGPIGFLGVKLLLVRRAWRRPTRRATRRIASAYAVVAAPLLGSCFAIGATFHAGWGSWVDVFFASVLAFAIDLAVVDMLRVWMDPRDTLRDIEYSPDLTNY